MTDKEVVGGMDSKWVGLCMKRRLTDKLFTVSRNELDLGGAVSSQTPKFPKILKHHKT